MAVRTEYGRSRDSVMRQRILQGKQKAQKDAERRAREVAEMSVGVSAELVRDTERRKSQKLAQMNAEWAEKKRVEEAEARAEAKLEALLADKAAAREAERREHARTVWIRGLPSVCSESQLTHYMKSMGSVVRAKVCASADEPWGLLTYTEHASAVKACECAKQDTGLPPWPAHWRIEAVSKDRMSSLEAQLLAETQEMSMGAYRLAQDRCDAAQADRVGISLTKCATCLAYLCPQIAGTSTASRFESCSPSLINSQRESLAVTKCRVCLQRWNCMLSQKQRN
jgi:hypothetical protein